MEESTGIRQVLHEAIEISTGRTPTPNDWEQSFVKLGMDSLDLVELQAKLEEFTNGRIELEGLLELTSTPSVVVSALAKEAHSEPWTPFLALQSPNEPSEDSAWRAEVERSVATTPRSRVLAQSTRTRIASSRFAAGVRKGFEDQTYPLFAQGGAGAWFTDVDGRRLLDLAMGFGVLLFGHNPPFVQRALARKIEEGFVLGPLDPQLDHLARGLESLTGHARFAFFNSGTEAVMAALRMARASTGRNRVVTFAGAYHGTFDGVMGVVGEGASFPGSLGTPLGMVQDLVVLSYGADSALEWIREHGTDLAAVMIEPIQARRPEFQPVEFVRELRKLTEASGAALIFDEMLTGFRVHPAGCQGLWGIRADLGVYGKVIGGGLPVGLVGGGNRWLAPVDGGQFGEPSARARRALFAGTFNHHPLMLASAQAVVDTLLQQGPELQQRLTARCTEMVSSLNASFSENGIAAQVVSFASAFRWRFDDNDQGDAFHRSLGSVGVYTWEGKSCFLSTEHQQPEVDFLLQAADRAVEAISSRRIKPVSREPSPSRTSAEMNGLGMVVDGNLELDRFEGALREVAASHGLREVLEVELGTKPVSASSAAAALAEQAEQKASRLRTSVHRTGEGSWFIGLTADRNLLDGWSIGVLLREIVARYHGFPLRREPSFAGGGWEHSGVRELGSPRRVSYHSHRLDGDVLKRCSHTWNVSRLSCLLSALSSTCPVKLEGEFVVPVRKPPSRRPNALGAFTQLIPLSWAQSQGGQLASLTERARAFSDAIHRRGDSVVGGSHTVINVDPVRSEDTFLNRAVWVPIPFAYGRHELVVNVAALSGSTYFDWKFDPLIWRQSDIESWASELAQVLSETLDCQLSSGSVTG